MNWISAAIYGAAAVIAIQALLALMTAHRQASLKRCYEEELGNSQSVKPTGETASVEKQAS